MNKIKKNTNYEENFFLTLVIVLKKTNISAKRRQSLKGRTIKLK